MMGSMHEPLTIDCDTCVMQDTGTCDDCVVSFFFDREHEQPVVLDLEELRSIRLLADAGLVPDLQHRPRTTSAPATMAR